MILLPVYVKALLLVGISVCSIVLYNKDNFEGFRYCLAVWAVVLAIFFAYDHFLEQSGDMKCPECDTQVSSEYCPDCGSAVTATTACLNCGEQSNTAYCSQCGTKMP